MVVFEARAPVGSPQQRLEGTGQVNEAVQHQKEHGEKRRQNVHVAEKYSELAEGCIE